jgi:hypothetical protein
MLEDPRSAGPVDAHVDETIQLKSKASTVQLGRVETTDGRFLGHVFDLRCRYLVEAIRAGVILVSATKR